MPTSTAIFRSPRSRDCEERAFVLAAVGIASTLDFDAVEYELRVDEANAAQALAELAHYESESRPVAPQSIAPKSLPNAWVGVAIYVALLTGIAIAVSHGLGRLDAFDVGELDAARLQDGQWWRAWTALTLHLDLAHLAANLGAGAWFGYLAAAQIGSGTAWLLIVTGAACANTIEAQWGPAAHRAVGASTAVFTALGLLAAHSWRTRFHLPQRKLHRWGPLVAGLALLGFTGSAGEGTDIVAHALGFVVGTLLGAIVGLPKLRRLLARVPQWLTGVVALASIALAWECALRS